MATKKNRFAPEGQNFISLAGRAGFGKREALRGCQTFIPTYAKPLVYKNSIIYNPTFPTLLP